MKQTIKLAVSAALLSTAVVACNSKFSNQAKPAPVAPVAEAKPITVNEQEFTNDKQILDESQLVAQQQGIGILTQFDDPSITNKKVWLNPLVLKGWSKPKIDDQAQENKVMTMEHAKRYLNLYVVSATAYLNKYSRPFIVIKATLNDQKQAVVTEELTTLHPEYIKNLTLKRDFAKKALEAKSDEEMNKLLK